MYENFLVKKNYPMYNDNNILYRYYSLYLVQAHRHGNRQGNRPPTTHLCRTTRVRGVQVGVALCPLGLRDSRGSMTCSDNYR